MNCAHGGEMPGCSPRRVTIVYVAQQRQHRIPCVGAIIKDEAGRLLLVLRAHSPGKDLWSIPGGRVEPGESEPAAVVREVREETGLIVSVGPLAGRVSRPGDDNEVIDIADYVCWPIGGTLTPGDDAADARWVSQDGLNSLQLTDGLLDALSEWGILGHR
jgi:ADP-ribose pyrophosphatase YjhB (NUDIX family)